MFFKKPNCSLCYYEELEFMRTETIFNSQISKKYWIKSKKNNLTFYTVDCNRHQRMCKSYGCYGVPAIILANSNTKEIYRYNGEKSALCERLTAFIIEKTKIQPQNKYYKDMLNDITNEQNDENFENKLVEVLFHINELNIINFSYVHQYFDLKNIKQMVSAGCCVALALPLNGMIPFHTRVIFDSFFKKKNFYPIVIKNKNGYRIEEKLGVEVSIILFNNRGNLPILVNNSISSIIDIIDYFCFVDGRTELRQFVEMMLFQETQKTISVIEKKLLTMKSQNSTSSKISHSLSSSTDFSTSKLNVFSSTDSTFQSSDSSVPISSSPKSTNNQTSNLNLPYEFRYFAEEPEKLISFAKTMYAENSLEHVISSINQLQKMIMHENIKKSVQEKLSQRIAILSVIKQIFFEKFLEKRAKNDIN